MLARQPTTWIQEQGSELATYRPAHLPCSRIFRDQGDGQSTVRTLMQAAGNPPEEKLDYEALDPVFATAGSNPEGEGAFLVGHASTLGDPRARAPFCVRCAAAHHDIGLHDAVRRWMSSPWRKLSTSGPSPQ